MSNTANEHRPVRTNAGVPAPHFSQDDRLYAAPAKRQRVDALQPCQHCSRVHRSDNELDRCQRSIEAAERSEAAARRDAEKARREFLRAARHCDRCGGSHSSEQQRLRCSRQRPARPLQPMPSQV